MRSNGTAIVADRIMIMVAAGTMAAAGMTVAIGTAHAGGRPAIMAGATGIAGPNGAGTTACASAAEVEGLGGGFGRRLAPGDFPMRCA